MLNIALETFLLTLLLAPGMISSLIWMKYSKTKPQTDKFYFSVYSIIFSVGFYGLYYAICGLFCNNPIWVIDFLKDSTIDISEFLVICYSTLIGFVIISICIYGSHEMWIRKLMIKLKITNQDGEENIWESALHRSMSAKAYIKIYDFKKDFIYFGFVEQISEKTQNKEIVLSEVEIINNATGETINKMKKIYLIFDHQDFFIQFFN